MSAFLAGLTSGAFQGAVGALQAQDAMLDIRAKRRAEEAAKDLSQMFQEAAKAGGLAKMPDEWFDRAASSVAATGDIKNALALTEVGTTLRAKRVRDAAYRASALIGAGAYGAATNDINEVFASMGAPTRFSSGSETEFMTTDGRMVPVQRLLDTMTRMSTTPEEYYKLAFEKMQTEARAARDLAAAERSRVDALATATLLGPRVEQAKAAAASSRAAAGAAGAQAEEARARTARLKALLPLEVDEKTLDLDKKLKDLTRADGVAATRAMQLYDAQVTAYRETNSTLGVDGSITKPEAIADPWSPELAPAGRRRVLQHMQNGLGEVEALDAWESEALAARDVLLAANPELASDPVLLASIMASLATDPNIPTATDAEGEYFIATLPTGRVKLYIERTAGTEAE